MMIKKRLISVLMVFGLVLGCVVVQVMGAVGEWEELAPMQIGRRLPAIEAWGEKLYVFGGLINGSQIYPTEIYDPRTDTWSYGSQVPNPDWQMNAHAIGNYIYVIGGTTGNVKLVRIYDVANDTWSMGSQMQYPRTGIASAVVGDKIYVFGNNMSFEEIYPVEVYDTLTDSWIEGPLLPDARRNAAAVAAGDKIFILGGYVKGKSETPILIYDTVKSTFTETNVMLSTQIRDKNAIIDGSKIYLVGGTMYRTYIDIFDYITNTLSTEDLRTIRLEASAVKLDNKIYIVGGTPQSVSDYTLVESFEIEGLPPIDPPEPTNNRLSVLLEETETARLIVTDRLTDNTNYLWTSSDEEVATVDDTGRVTAIAPGLALITAESPDGVYSDSIPVRVVPKGAAGERLAVYLEPGNEQWLYLNDDYENIEWESMEPEVVEVDDMGKLTALKKGLAIVKAAYEDEEYLIYVRVG